MVDMETNVNYGQSRDVYFCLIISQQVIRDNICLVRDSVKSNFLSASEVIWEVDAQNQKLTLSNSHFRTRFCHAAIQWPIQQVFSGPWLAKHCKILFTHLPLHYCLYMVCLLPNQGILDWVRPLLSARWSGRSCDLWPSCWNCDFGSLEKGVWPGQNFWPKAGISPEMLECPKVWSKSSKMGMFYAQCNFASLVQFVGLLVVGPFSGYDLVMRPHMLLSVILSQMCLVCWWSDYVLRCVCIILIHLLMWSSCLPTHACRALSGEATFFMD